MYYNTIFQKIYDSEINCRIEWCFDGGVTWSIQNSEFPRIWKDDVIDNNKINYMTSNEYNIKSSNNVLTKDWIARGTEENFEKAFNKLIDAIIECFPNSEFTKWIKNCSLYKEIKFDLN